MLEILKNLPTLIQLFPFPCEKNCLYDEDSLPSGLQKEQEVSVNSQLLNAVFSIHGFREERFYFKVCFTQYKKESIYQ